jgi:hypothetical protein
LDPSIKRYADSIYEKELFDSAATTRQESIKHAQERSKFQNNTLAFNGFDFQAQLKIYVDHIERCVAARLNSYQTAFNEINKLPSETELREILEDCKATWELQIKHTNQSLSSLVKSGHANGLAIDTPKEIRAASARGHDRVLQEWKVWRSKVLLKSSSNLQSLSPSGTPTISKQAEGQNGVMKSAFISYSWDDDAHRDWVRTLAQRLRADGVEVALDRWAAVPGEQLPAFMERAIRENEFVIIICTPRYKQRSDARVGGVGYEGDIMTAEVMNSQNNRKFIPVLRSGTWQKATPSWLSGKYYINLGGSPYSERDYEDLVRTLLGIRETAPPVGKPMSTLSPKTAGRESISTPPSSSSQFEDIKITRVIVEEVTEPRNDGTPGCALYSIPFALSSEPPVEWEKLFIENWDNPPRFSTMHRPGIASVDGATVTLNGTTVEEVERYHRDTLQLALGETNKQYRGLLQPEERESKFRDQHRRIVEDSAKRIKFD